MGIAQPLGCREDDLCLPVAVPSPAPHGQPSPALRPAAPATTTPDASAAVGTGGGYGTGSFNATFGPPPSSHTEAAAAGIDPRLLDPRDTATSALPSYIEEVERAAIEHALKENRYNKTKTAASLGITFRALRYKLKKLGID